MQRLQVDVFALWTCLWNLPRIRRNPWPLIVELCIVRRNQAAGERPPTTILLTGESGGVDVLNAFVPFEGL